VAVDVLSRHREWVQANPLKRWRDAHGASAMEAAGIVGVSTHAVYGWEAGASRPSEESMDQLAKILGSDVRTQWDAWEREKPSL